MAAKTKEPTRTEHLAERIEEHRAVIAGIEAQAAKMDEEAQAADARAAAILSDFSRPAEGLAEDVQAHKNTATYGRDGAQLLRQRAAAYAATNQVESLENEHRYLVGQEKARIEAEAAAVRTAQLTKEFEARVAQYGQYLLAVEALEWRINWLSDQNISAPRAFAATNEAKTAMRSAVKNMTTDAQRQEFMRTHLPKLAD